MKELIYKIKAKMLPPTSGDTEANYNFNKGYDFALKEVIKLIQEIHAQHAAWNINNLQV